MHPQVRFYERAYRNNFELIKMRIVERRADQLAAQTTPPQPFRNFRMGQGDVLLRAMVLQDGCLFSQRDLKLALCLVMRDRIAVHETFAMLPRNFFSKFYAIAAPEQYFVPDTSQVPFTRRSSHSLIVARPPIIIRSSLDQIPTCATGPLRSSDFSLTGHEPARQASR